MSSAPPKNDGFIVISNVAYRRSKFVKSSTSTKDWALFGLLMLGIVFSLCLMVFSVALLGWAAYEVVHNVWRQVWH